MVFTLIGCVVAFGMFQVMGSVGHGRLRISVAVYSSNIFVEGSKAICGLNFVRGRVVASSL